MVKSCWICKTAGNNLAKSYFRIPKVLFHRSSQISELSALRKEKWRDILLLPDDTSGIRICSDHFLSGNPARLLDVNDPDWVPTRNLKQETAKKESKTLSLVGQRAHQLSCRLCFELVNDELCVNIFEAGKKKFVRMVEFILGHKVALKEGESFYACKSCLRKVRICSRLVTYFRKNEKRFYESLQNNRMECRKVKKACQNGRKISVADVDDRKSREEMIVPGDTCTVYDSEQIRSIIEDNSVSSEEDPTESRIPKCKRRKYNLQSVSVRPVELKTLKCNNCYRKFDNVNDLKDHKNFCKLFYCRLCKPQIIFTEKVEQEKHKKKYHLHSLVCHICGKNYSQSYLMKHFKNHFEERKKCPFCHKILRNITIYMTHLDNVHGNRFSTVCEVCGGSFKNLKKHLVLCRKFEADERRNDAIKL